MEAAATPSDEVPEGMQVDACSGQRDGLSPHHQAPTGDTPDSKNASALKTTPGGSTPTQGLPPSISGKPGADNNAEVEGQGNLAGVPPPARLKFKTFLEKYPNTK